MSHSREQPNGVIECPSKSAHRRYRILALVLFLETTAFKPWVWRDPLSWGLAFATGRLLAVAESRLEPVPASRSPLPGEGPSYRYVLMSSFLHRRALVACLAVVPLLGCEDPTASLPREGPPDELRFSFGGFATEGVTIELQNHVVALWRTPWNWLPGVAIDTVRAVPTDQAWREFWIAAERAGVHRWRSRYLAEDIIDGNGWAVRIVADDFELESTGSNAYPDARGRERELEMTEEFRAFRAALGDLVGEEL